MKLSLIIPAFNVVDTIDAALDSVLAQTLMPDEIIVIDDGSTDQTMRCLERRRTDFNTIDYRIIQQAHGGPGAARNRGIKEARGSWLTFLDADDVLYPNHILIWRQMIESYPENHFFATWIEVLDSVKGPIKIDTREMFKRFPLLREAIETNRIVLLPPSSPGLLWACPISSDTAFIRKSAIEAIGAHYGNKPRGADYMFWIWLFAHYGLVFSPTVTAQYRHEGGKPVHHLRHTAKYIISNMAYLRTKGVFEGVERQMGRALAQHLVALTHTYYRAGLKAETFHAATNALKNAPFSLASIKAMVVALLALVGHGKR